MNTRALPEDLSPVTAIPILRDHRWLELTSAANQAFKDGAVEPARRLYTRAVEEAERLFETRNPKDTAVPLPAIMNIACHNLAQLAAQDGNEPECRRLLILAFDRLINAARQPSTPIELRIACVQHLKYTLSELAGHLAQQFEPEPSVEHYTDRLREAVAAVSHAAAHVGQADDPRRCGHCRLTN
ncbi:hypothetical protein D2T31_16945 [Sinirhodobacter populi]|uniref:DUF2254 domain-containing protein n=1 Tax=Paenirhodobacter populi TaxID=2306993 RepID=A0A443K3J7_9RHOB|nr:hypothetical protein [Sinirhodobacter populi]RWR27339.1 hypothetical protein D2T31_16945 [Sinirhodobacter populi]